MSGVEVSWSSGGARIVEVSASGLVKAADNGTVTITATAGEASGTAEVRVVQLIASVVVSPSEDTVFIGDSVRLMAEALDGNRYAIEGVEFTWSSSDESVAAVNESGLVDGLGEGATTITATAQAVHGNARTVVFHPDRPALEALYLATDGPNWSRNWNWLSDVPIEDWAGVVTGVPGGAAPSGPIPRRLNTLAHVTALYLASNGLSGPIPPELSAIYVNCDITTG